MIHAAATVVANFHASVGIGGSVEATPARISAPTGTGCGETSLLRVAPMTPNSTPRVMHPCDRHAIGGYPTAAPRGPRTSRGTCLIGPCQKRPVLAYPVANQVAIRGEGTKAYTAS